MSTPVAELDFDSTMICSEPLELGAIIRSPGPGGLGDWSGVVEWVSDDTAIVVVRHVEWRCDDLKVGQRIRFVWA